MTSRASSWGPLFSPASASRYTGMRPSTLVPTYRIVTQKLPEPMGSNTYRRQPRKSQTQPAHTNPANAFLRPDPKQQTHSNTHRPD
ncbi:hypothetical protein SAMN04515695_4817 [Pseudovibrio sp. Tun.PSC04-5.I4]|nr:hypothetical protein SAMN04515695_2528 [Pseudovibrio sp. Tun.PSC04-5.I4]SDR35066.1 hypothetical protein SAMN04515695_4814 [Pseudovibrio sp. Tun.PSC04-5.I4]SDR35091.1 hypothetical protein SAMN04515695_4817 [Pseudovibrio sp. Tun.PSC04-5.I4]